MSIINLSSTFKVTKKRKRVGRGYASGTGKTCGRGHKGQKARSGVSNILVFEGGQTPIHRRLPRRGFTSRKKRFTSVTLQTIYSMISLKKLTDKISKLDMISVGLISGSDQKVKIIGDSRSDISFSIECDAVSAGAKKVMDDLGCRVMLSQDA